MDAQIKLQIIEFFGLIFAANENPEIHFFFLSKCMSNISVTSVTTSVARS